MGAASAQSGAPELICQHLLVSLCQRHGVAVLLVLLLCASLFLVYNGSFSGAARDANDTRVRQHDQLRRPTGAPVRVAKPRPPVLQGYSGIIDHKVSRCGCALRGGGAGRTCREGTAFSFLLFPHHKPPILSAASLSPPDNTCTHTHALTHPSPPV